MRAIVVGAGVSGLCAAWALRRAGHEVTVLERAGIPHVGGTSHDQHRLTRYPYGAQAGYCAMMRDAFAAWEMVWRDLGQSHYARTGCLSLSTAPGDWTEASADTLDRLGIRWERLSPAQTAAQFPMLRTHDVRFGLQMDEGGVLFADRIVEGLAAWLRAHGATLRSGVEAASVDGGAVRTGAGEVVRGDAVIVAAGVWAAALAPALADAYTPVRQVVAYVAPPPALAPAWQTAPIMMDLGSPRGMYLAPPVRGRGMKIGVGAYNRPIGPGLPEPAGPGEGAALLDFYRDRFVDWAGFRVTGTRVCHYANEPAHQFLLRRHAGAWVLTGCSGHGFKFGALMGLGLAAAATGAQPEADLIAWAAGEQPRLDVMQREAA